MEFLQQTGLVATVVILPFCYWLWAIAYRHPTAFKPLSILVLELEFVLFIAALGYWIGVNASGGVSVEFVQQDKLSAFLTAHDEILPPLILFLLMLLFAAYLLFLRVLPELGITSEPPAPPISKKPGDDKAE